MSDHDTGSGTLKPAATTNTCAIAVRRHGREVQVLLTWQDEYAAIQSYDEIVTAAQRGQLRITVQTKADPKP